jgi:DNA-binding response OmpR family regulator
MKKPKILVVDDEEDFHHILRQVLEPAGYEVVSAADGAQGLEAARRERPDALILDVNMPVKDGYAVCQELRGDPELAELPVLMLTIRNQDAAVIEGLDRGADDYLTKPFSSRELLSRLRNLLQRS